MDRAAAAFLASALHAGALRTVRAHYRVREHDVRIIRPFIYVRARSLEDFAHERALPSFGHAARDCEDNSKKILDRSVSVPCGSCKEESLEQEVHLSESLPELIEPLSAAQELLNSQERLHPYIFTSLKSALHPLISARGRRVHSAAAAHGYGAVAVAQTMDRAAAAFLASALHAGALRTVRAHYRVREHDVRIIRPFIYVRARSLEDFAHERALPSFGHAARDCEDNSKKILDRSVSVPCGSCKEESLEQEVHLSESLPELIEPLSAAQELLNSQERLHPYIFTSLKSALHPLISARNVEKESRHRKKSVIQMKNGAPVYDSEEGTEEEPVP